MFQLYDNGVQLKTSLQDVMTGEDVAVSGIVSATLLFKKPDNSLASGVASINTDDDTLDYTFEDDVLDMAGTWHYQYVIGDSITKRTDVGSFRVRKNL